MALSRMFSRALPCLTLAVGTAVAGFAPTTASAEPAAKPPTSASVQQQISDLGRQIEQLAEDHNAAVVQRDNANQQVSVAAGKVKTFQATLDQNRGRVRALAVGAYQGVATSDIAQLLVARDPRDLILRLEGSNFAAQKKEQVLATVHNAREGAKREQANAEKAAAQADQLVKDLDAQKAAIEQKLAAYQKLLGQLTDQERANFFAQSGSTQAPQQSSAPVQEQKPAATEPTQAASSPTAQPAPTRPTARPTSVKARPTPAPAPRPAPKPAPKPKPKPKPAPSGPTDAASVAVHAALSKLGSPYVWGATGPSTFDCSGLMQWAYKQAGVTLPRVSRDQARFGTPVSRSQLRPGDLIGIYSPVSHIVMYIGNGQVVHAPQPGDVVKVSSIDRVGPITAMTRPTG